MSRKNSEGSSRGGISRRTFLRTAAGATGGSLLVPSVWAAPTSRLDLAPGQELARVALARSQMTLDGPTVHRRYVRELLETSLAKLTGTTSARDAWHSLLREGDVIGLKFNRSGQRIIGTTDAMAEAIVGSLVDAGWPASKIVCIEIPTATADRLGVTPPVTGFDRTPTKFGSGEDTLASFLHQVTALISVPFLKTHNICTLTCALKNISHAVVKHPARFHDNECAPFIPDIVSIPAIRDLLRLAIVDALRVVYVDGPAATSHNLTNAGGLILSTDLVAADAVGLALLNDVRKRTKLPPVVASPEEVPYLVAAHRSRLGIAAPHGINLLRIGG